MAHLTRTSYMRARRVSDSQDNLQQPKRSPVVFDLNTLDCHDLVLTDIEILSGPLQNSVQDVDMNGHDSVYHR